MATATAGQALAMDDTVCRTGAEGPAHTPGHTPRRVVDGEHTAPARPPARASALPLPDFPRRMNDGRNDDE